MNRNYFVAVSPLDLPEAFNSISHDQLKTKLLKDLVKEHQI